MTSPKRPRENASAPETSTTARTLPADLMLEIVARSDARALIRCAAASKLLRRDILSPSFIRRVVHRGSAPCILVHLSTYRNHPSTLVHPVTHNAASLCDDHLIPFLSRSVAGLFDDYNVLTSRRGLVVLLLRRSNKDRPKPSGDLCVYDPMSGTRKFLPKPPEIGVYGEYALLTAADGIDSSFLLLALDQCGWSIKVQSASSCGTWGPAMNMCDGEHTRWLLENPCNPAVLHGGVIHWLEHEREQIVRYDVSTGKLGLVKIPHRCRCCNVKKLHLATSSDGKLLKLLAIERLRMYVWLQLPVSASSGGGSDWSLGVVIDMEEKLRSPIPNIVDGLYEPVEFKGSGSRSGEVVFLEVGTQGCIDVFIAFDLETKEVHMQRRGFTLLEIDLPSRLQTMKIFS